MNVPRLFLPVALSLLSLTTWSGCGAGQAYDIGRRAEQRGDAHLAHDYYVRAGVKRPGNAAIRAGLKRTAPAAVEFWRKQAGVAQDQGRYDDAWRMLMRALAILPNDQQTLEAIRKLESEHGQAIAAAKADWQKRGSAALEVQLARADDDAGETKAAPQPPPAAEETKPQALARTTTAPPKPAIEPTPTAQALAGHAPSAARIDDRDTAAEHPKRDEIAAHPTTDEPFTLHYADSKRESDDEPTTDKRRDVTQEAPTASPNHDAPRTDRYPPVNTVDNAPVLTEEEYARELDRRKEARSPSHEGSDFLVVRTLSRKNKRIPKQGLLIDGVVAKVKDTDDELDADLNLYVDGKKVKEIRNLGIGRARSFQGKSGRSYLLTILSIHHASHTVRIGVNPA